MKVILVDSGYSLKYLRRPLTWRGVLAWRVPLLVVALAVGALALRVWGLGWGLPYVEHPDEPSILQTALRMVRHGDLHPQRFDKPTGFFYLLAATTRLYAEWAMRSGMLASPQDLPQGVGLFTTMPELFVWNRALTALLGAATVPLLYLLGRDSFGRRAGLLAAGLLAIAYFHLEHSTYITTDVPSAVGVVVALLGACRILTGGQVSAYLLAGVGAGLAAGTKYNAGIAVLGLLLAHPLFWGRRSLGLRPLRLFVLGGLAALLTFLLTTPYALIDGQRFIGGLLHLDANYGGDSITLADRWTLLLLRSGEYASFFWERSLFPAGCLALLAGLPLLLRRAPRPTFLLLAVIVAELAILATYKVHFMRNVLAVFPLLIVLVAAGTVALADLIRGSRLQALALTLLVLALAAPQLEWSTWLLRYSNRPHTMALAAARLRELPRGMRAAVETNPVQWSGDPTVFPLKRVGDQPLDWYRANGFRYLIVNDERRDREDEGTNYDEIVAAAQVVERYPERRLGVQPGPGGALLDLGEHPELLGLTPRQAHFGGLIELLGYEIQPGDLRAQNSPLEGADEHSFAPGQPAQINLYWRAVGLIDHDYTLFVHVFDAQGNRVAQRDLPPRHEDYPTSHWQPGELVVDRADMALPALPPGEYRLEIGLYNATDGKRLPLEAEGLPPDAAFPLATLRVEP